MTAVPGILDLQGSGHRLQHDRIGQLGVAERNRHVGNLVVDLPIVDVIRNHRRDRFREGRIPGVRARKYSQ